MDSKLTDDLIACLRISARDYGYRYGNDAADALEAQARRIAELGKMLAVHRLAVDVDALKARIAVIEAENEELKKAISKPWMGSARAAYLGEKE
jgi:hypothetical protein